MKRITLWAVAAVTAAALLFPVGAEAVSAGSCILLDAQTGRVLYARSADRRSLIASTTKIMTALVVCQQCNVLSRVRIPAEAVGVEGSSMYLREGEILTVQELLYGLMLHSGNDAAVALAIYCGGTLEGFVGLMNDKARQLGLKNTHFANPHGLDAPDHYSTAEDLALLAACAMDDPLFAMTVSTKQVTVGQRFLRNHNKLLWRVEGADGVKTGYTRAAGRILVSSAVRKGRRLICVTIDDPDDWNDHAWLLEQGFSRYTVHTVVQAGQCLGTVQVAGGSEPEAQLIAAEDFAYPLEQGEGLTVELPGAGFVYAPVREGTDAGKAHIFLESRCVGTVPLVYGQTVAPTPEGKRSIFGQLLELFS